MSEKPTLALQRERLRQHLNDAGEQIDSVNYYFGESKIGPEGNGIGATAEALSSLRLALAILATRLDALEDAR